MAEPKTKPTAVSVDEFLNEITDAQQRADAFQIVEMMKQITGEPAKMWGPSIVGCGTYHYVYDSGHEGDTCLTGLSPRKSALTLYFTGGFEERLATRLQKLGKAKTSKGCLYVKKLADIDAEVLRDMIRENVAYLRDLAARPSKPAPAKKGRK